MVKSMAKTTKKATAGMSSLAPVMKKTTTSGSKNSGAGLVSMTSGGSKTAKAKAEYEKAKRGGAAKAAKKLTKPVKTVAGPAYRWRGSDGVVGTSNHQKYTYEDAGMGSAKQVKQNILNDKSKTATRAKIAEMNAKKKASKPKSTGPSTASKIKGFFEEKPKYSSEVIVWNKKMDAAEAARKKKK